MESALRNWPPKGDHDAGLKVIETFRYEAGAGFLRLPQHLERCARTCETLGAPFDAADVRRALSALAPPALARIRLTVDMAGRMEIRAEPMSEALRVWRLALAPQRLNPGDRWLRFKTTRRALYDTARAKLPEGVDEMLFANNREQLCEGAISNVFVDFGEGLVTPPVSDGLLPGVLRAQLIESGQAREESISLARLDDAKNIFVGNSLRGLMPAAWVQCALR